MKKGLISTALLLVIVLISYLSVTSESVLGEAPTERLPILLYHHLLPQSAIDRYGWGGNGAVISVENFEAQMNYLYTNGFHSVSLDELEGFLFRSEPLPPRAVMIQFDDGYYSNWVYAMPILERYGFVAQQFLIGGPVYDRGDRQPPFSHENLVFTAMSTIEGTEHVWETANHTYRTHHLAEGTELTAFVAYDLEKVRADIIRGFDFVNDHRAFAYPRGMYNQERIDLLRELGMTMAFTTQSGYVAPETDPMRLPRFIIWPTTRMNEFQRIVNGSR